jgi:hypothetical protein
MMYDRCTFRVFTLINDRAGADVGRCWSVGLVSSHQCREINCDAEWVWKIENRT